MGNNLRIGFTGCGGIQRFTQVYTGLHRFTQVYTGYHELLADKITDAVHVNTETQVNIKEGEIDETGNYFNC